MPFGGLLTMGAVSAGGSVLSGIFGKNAADKAANIQANAAKQAGNQVVDTTAAVNPQIGEAAAKAGAGVTAAADSAAGTVLGANDQANALLKPYALVGDDAAAKLRSRLGDLTKTPTMADLQLDPGFAFRMQQGVKALAASAASRGAALGGAAGKAITRYSQGEAAQEYQSAFDRYRATQSDAFNRLFGVTQAGQAVRAQEGQNTINTNEYAGTVRTGAQEYAGNAGLSAANAMSANTINAARAYGDYLTQGANAKAAGTVGGSNALWSGISGGANSLMNAFSLKNILQTLNPAHT